MDNDKRHSMCMKQCSEIGFESPLQLNEFEKMSWNDASLYSNSDVSDGPFMILAEMKKEKRNWSFPFCHPGPMFDSETKTNGWYYPDKISQKVHLLNDNSSYYIVRWVGFEDEFNTLKHADVMKIRAKFSSKGYNPCRNHFIRWKYDVLSIKVKEKSIQRLVSFSHKQVKKQFKYSMTFWNMISSLFSKSWIHQVFCCIENISAT